MFKITYSDKRSTLEIYDENNCLYLIQDHPDFKLLSELSCVSYDVFNSEDMDKLIFELKLVSEKIQEPSAGSHIEDIIELAYRCKNNKEGLLIFSPF